MVKSILAIRGHQMTSQSSSLPRVWDLYPAHAEAEPCPLEPRRTRFWCHTCVSVSSTRLLQFWPQRPAVLLASFPNCHISEWKMHSFLLASRIQGKSYLHIFLPCQAYSLCEWKLHCRNSNKPGRFEGHERECRLTKDK